MKSSKFILSTLIAAAAMTSTAWAKGITEDTTLTDATISEDVYVGSGDVNPTLTLEGTTSITGKVYVGQDGTGEETGKNLDATLDISGDVTHSGYMYVDDNATLNITSGNSLDFTGNNFTGNNKYHFLVIGGTMNVGGELSIDGCSTRFSRATVKVDEGAAITDDGQVCVYGSNVTVNGAFNITHGENMASSLILGWHTASGINNIDTTTNFVVSGANAKVTVKGGDNAATARTDIHTDENNKVGSLIVEKGGTFETDGVVNNNGVIDVTNGTFTAGTVANNGTFTVSGKSKLNIANASGSAIRVSDGATLLGGTSVNGVNVATMGTLTIDGVVTIGSGKYLYNYYENNVWQQGTLTVNGTLTGGNLQYYYADIQGNGTINVENVMLRDSTVSTDINASYGLYFYKGTVIDGATITHGHSAGDQVAWISGNTTFQNGAKFVLTQDSLYMSVAGVKFTANASTVEGVTMSLLNADNVFTLENGATATFSGKITNNGTITVTNSTLSAGEITNNGTIKFSENSTLESGVLIGNVTIESGATLTVASSSLLANVIENKTLTNNGTIVYKAIDTEQTLDKDVSISAGVEGSSVTLTAGVDGVKVSKAEAILEKGVEIEANINGVAKNVKVLAAWSFVVSVESGKSVTVEMDVGKGLSADEIRILHKADDATEWKDAGEFLANMDESGKKFSYDSTTGKVTFNATSFSSYAAANVPEPSVFGLLAGLGALALVAARRRRRK